MKKAVLSKPKFLSLDQEAKQNIIVRISSNNLDDSDKQITQECMLFTAELEKQLKDPSITLQQVKKLFEVYSKKTLAAQ